MLLHWIISAYDRWVRVMEGGKGWGFKGEMLEWHVFSACDAFNRCWVVWYMGERGDGYQTYQSNIFTVYSIQKLFGGFQNLSDIKFKSDKHFVRRTTVWINNQKWTFFFTQYKIHCTSLSHTHVHVHLPRFLKKEFLWHSGFEKNPVIHVIPQLGKNWSVVANEKEYLCIGVCMLIS